MKSSRTWWWSWARTYLVVAWLLFNRVGGDGGCSWVSRSLYFILRVQKSILNNSKKKKKAYTYFHSRKLWQVFERKIVSLSFGFMINVISAWQRAPNSSSLYSSCLLSCWYQIYLITWTLHSKLSVVSFVANYGVLLPACCIMSKVRFLIARCDIAVHSPSSLVACGLMRAYVILL